MSFTEYNTDGYSAEEIANLNEEFSSRMYAAEIEEGSEKYDQMFQEFSNEVAKR